MECSNNLVGLSVVDPSAADLSRARAFGPIFSPLPTPIRILIVIDGRIVLSKDPSDFGLGYVLETLRGPIRWWVRFEVDIGKRDGASVAGDDVNPLTYPNFKFTNAGFNLDSYHQVWFFADLPSANDGADGTTDADILTPFTLDDDELKLLAEWMDRGGGVFAAGDHSILGASMCHRIPRVRTMRKWTHAQGVPTRDGPGRYQTLQPNEVSGKEGDSVLQPVELVYRPIPGPLPFLRPLMPHPVLCSRQGPIDRFPDHMHEGEVIRDNEVALDRALDIPNYNRPEYPTDPTGGQRPRPQVVAWGQTTNRRAANQSQDLTPGSLATAVVTAIGPTRFGLVGAYDGNLIGIGRVVVDSTWHHWFSLNLNGIAAAGTLTYEKMRDYYENIGLWLTTPALRQSILISGTWGVLTESAPMRFSKNDSPWQIGEQVLETLSQTMSPCLIGQLVDPYLDQDMRAASSSPPSLPGSEPSWSGLPADLVNRAIVGGIGSALLDLALNHRDKRARGERPRLDAEAIRQRAIVGVSRGHALLRKSVEDAATVMSALHKTLSASSGSPPIDVRIPIEVRRLRVVAETLQLPEPSDPVLIAGHVALTVRIRLDDSVVAHHILECVEVPSFEARGSIIDLSCDVGEVEVQTGESLSIEVLAGSYTSEEVNPEVIRFKDTLRGDASKWIGKRTPARSQAWRLWYRIEESRSPAYGA
jgi:hypothetical protein